MIKVNPLDPGIAHLRGENDAGLYELKNPSPHTVPNRAGVFSVEIRLESREELDMVLSAARLAQKGSGRDFLLVKFDSPSVHESRLGLIWADALEVDGRTLDEVYHRGQKTVINGEEVEVLVVNDELEADVIHFVGPLVAFATGATFAVFGGPPGWIFGSVGIARGLDALVEADHAARLDALPFMPALAIEEPESRSADERTFLTLHGDGYARTLKRVLKSEPLILEHVARYFVDDDKYTLLSTDDPDYLLNRIHDRIRLEPRYPELRAQLRLIMPNLDELALANTLDALRSKGVPSPMGLSALSKADKKALVEALMRTNSYSPKGPDPRPALPPRLGSLFTELQQHSRMSYAVTYSLWNRASPLRGEEPAPFFRRILKKWEVDKALRERVAALSQGDQEKLLDAFKNRRSLLSADATTVYDVFAGHRSFKKLCKTLRRKRSTVAGEHLIDSIEKLFR